MNGQSKARYRPTRYDAAALIVFFLLAFFMLFFSRRQWLSLDEASYYVMPQRFLLGDRFFADDWTFAQMTAVFHLLPYGLFRAVTGGSEGVIWYMKLLAVGVDLILYWYFYFKLRKKAPLAGIAAAFFLCADPNLGFWTLSYYAMTTHALTVLAAIVFLSEDELPAYQLSFAGVLLSCAVIMIPTTAALYLVFCVLVTVREIRGKQGRPPRLRGIAHLATKRAWLWTTAGVAVCAAAFLIFLTVNAGGVKPLLEGLSEILASDDMSEHSLSLEGLLTLLYIDATWPVAAFGAVTVGAMALTVTAATVIAVRMKRARPVPFAARVCVFALSVVLFAAGSAAAAVGIARTNIVPDPDLTLPLFADTAYNYMYFCILTTTAPTCFLALVNSLIARERDPGMTAFFIFTVLCSAAVDAVSNGSFLFGGRSAYLPAAYFTVGNCRDLLRERRQNDSVKGKALPAAAALLLCGAVLCRTGLLAAQALVNVPTKTTALQTIETGPYRGMLADEESIVRYAALHRDLDRIRQNSDGPVYIAAWFPYCYLYLDLPRGAHTAKFYSDEFEETANQTALVRYWREKPEKRPEYIYLPTVDETARPDPELTEDALRYMDFLSTVCDFDAQLGSAGTILRVTRWKL